MFTPIVWGLKFEKLIPIKSDQQCKCIFFKEMRLIRIPSFIYLLET